MRKTFTAGQLVRCIAVEPGMKIARGREYRVAYTRTDGSFPTVENDEGRLTQYSARWFELVSQNTANGAQPLNDQMLIALKSADAFLNVLSTKWEFCRNTQRMHDQMKVVIARAEGRVQ